jgi:hypothetical protein
VSYLTSHSIIRYVDRWSVCYFVFVAFTNSLSPCDDIVDGIPIDFLSNQKDGEVDWSKLLNIALPYSCSNMIIAIKSITAASKNET